MLNLYHGVQFTLHAHIFITLQTEVEFEYFMKCWNVPILLFRLKLRPVTEFSENINLNLMIDFRFLRILTLAQASWVVYKT